MDFMPKILQGKNVGNDEFFANIIPNYLESLNSICEEFRNITDLKFEFINGKNIEFKLSTGEVIFRLQRMKYEGTGKEIFALSPRLTSAAYRRNNESDYYEVITTAYYFTLGKLSLESEEDMTVLCKITRELVKCISMNQPYDYKFLLTLCGYSRNEAVEDTDEILFKCNEMSEVDQKSLVSNNNNKEVLQTLPSDKRKYKAILEEAEISINKQRGPKTIKVISADSKKWYKDFIGEEIKVVYCYSRSTDYTYKVSSEELERIIKSPLYKATNHGIQGLALSYKDVEVVNR